MQRQLQQKAAAAEKKARAHVLAEMITKVRPVHAHAVDQAEPLLSGRTSFGIGVLALTRAA